MCSCIFIVVCFLFHLDFLRSNNIVVWTVCSYEWMLSQAIILDIDIKNRWNLWFPFRTATYDKAVGVCDYFVSSRDEIAVMSEISLHHSTQFKWVHTAHVAFVVVCVGIPHVSLIYKKFQFQLMLEIHAVKSFTYLKWLEQNFSKNRGRL